MTKITTAEAPLALAHITAHLRPEDVEEFDAARGAGFDRVRLAMETSHAYENGMGWIAWRGDTQEPVATWGAMRMTPACVGCWAFGTSGWPRVIKSVTRHIHRDMVPALLKAGFHRAECRALAKREDTRLWLTSLGWTAEAVLAEFGTRRENFVLYAWTASRNAASKDHQPDDQEQGELPLRFAS